MTDTQFAENLREVLGAESAGRWLVFMDQIQSYLPFLLGSAGRPSKEDIDSSVIGTAGFHSWTEMVESSPTYGGLGWSIDSWKAWKRAYAVVQEHDYLREMNLTSSEINTLSREIKPFPKSKEDFEAVRASRREGLEASRNNAVASLKRQLTASQGEVSTLKTKVETLTDQLKTEKIEFTAAYDNWTTEKRRKEALNNELQQTKGLLQAAQNRLPELEEALKNATAENEKSLNQKNDEIKKLKTELKRYKAMTWLDHFRALFGR